MKINKKLVAVSLIAIGLSFCMSGVRADAAFVKRTEVKKTQQQKNRIRKATFRREGTGNYFFHSKLFLFLKRKE